MNDFLPKDYDVPVKPGKYMKFQDGENRFRILSTPIMGWEWWTDADGVVKAKGDKIRKGDIPVRVHMAGPVIESAAETAKHFWAMKVWNYKEEMIQVLQITQASIQKPIKSYANDEDWGSPLGYDIVVSKSGEGLDTEYQVKAKPAKVLDERIKYASEEVKVNLGALYASKDPFAETDETVPVDDIDKGIEELRKATPGK